jgi:hypothetical protein
MNMWSTLHRIVQAVEYTLDAKTSCNTVIFNGKGGLRIPGSFVSDIPPTSQDCLQRLDIVKSLLDLYYEIDHLTVENNYLKGIVTIQIDSTTGQQNNTEIHSTTHSRAFAFRVSVTENGDDAPLYYVAISDQTRSGFQPHSIILSIKRILGCNLRTVEEVESPGLIPDMRTDSNRMPQLRDLFLILQQNKIDAQLDDIQCVIDFQIFKNNNVQIGCIEIQNNGFVHAYIIRSRSVYQMVVLNNIVFVSELIHYVEHIFP